MSSTVTLTIRKRSTGYKIAALGVESLDHAWTIANVLVRSSEYARCFVVALNWDGSELFSVGFTPAPSAQVYSTPSYGPALAHSVASDETGAQDRRAVELQPSPPSWSHLLPGRK